MLKTKRFRKLLPISAVIVVLAVSLSLTVPMIAEDTPNPKSSNPNVTYQTIPIYMMMEAGVPFEQPWEGGGRLLHSGVGWMTPFGRSSYVAVIGYPEAAQYRPAFMDDPSWQDMFGSTRLFCIYSLPDGDIYAFDGVLANIEPGIDPPGPDEDDGKIDYLINVIVGGTGTYENATGMLLGRTPGRLDAGNETGLPLSLIKIMEGYINIVVKDSKYSTELPSVGMAMNPQVWPEAWEALESGELVPMNMEMEAGSDFYEPRGIGFTIHSGVGWLEPFGRAEYVAGVGYPEAPAYRPDFMDDPSWTDMFGSLGLFCIYSFNETDCFYAFDGIMGNIQPKVNDDGKMDYLMNIIVGGTGAFEDATGMLLGITPGRGTEDPVDGIWLPDSILKLMKGYVLIHEED